MLNMEFDGRFRIVGEIAKNDKAWVYHGIDRATDEEVAVKVLRPWSAASERLETRFAQEFKVLQTLEHPNIVRVIQTGVTPSRFHYFAMELLQGQTLTEKLGDHGRLSPQKVAEYLDQIADAIDTAHARGVVHRDINPSNIMLHRDPATGREVVKILDFGLAKIVDDGGLEVVQGLTSAGMSVGTPAYMSPEQAMGREIDELSDIYSLGVTLYALLTGALPYDRATDYATMVAHVSEPIPWFSERGAGQGIPLAVEEVVRQAMAKDPRDRPRTANELARMFRERAENPEAAPPISSGRAASTEDPAPPFIDSPVNPTAAAPAAVARMIPISNWLLPILMLLGLGLIVGVIVLALK